ncbi:hypothetical protein MBEBAB_0698 [Brevundimonas abyssalis TAR-001]|uniref:DUF6249 domain-containing protein n=2 Tax=Caulobacteraceae TaxID=76892 RepID=A0A8E0KHU4_9CAUL|nr:hypothetical protein MBEBAB_0698 [Brevundimonas abyssalis TAR-001]
MVVAIIAIPAWLKSRDRREMQQTLRTAIEKGQALPPEVIDALSQDAAKTVPSAARDLRVGVIWLAVAVGIAAAGWGLSYADGDSEIFYVMGGLCAIPGFIGLAFIILSFFNKNKG